VPSLLAAIALLLAWSAPAAAHARPASHTFRNARFELTLPPGWFVAEQRPDRSGRRFVSMSGAPAGDARVLHFADGGGNYLSVYVDHAADLEADAIWNVRVAADAASVEIGGEGAMCGSSGGPGPMGPCSGGNGTLEIGTLPPLKLRGHVYAFHFGNTRQEHGVDLEPFRWILGSFRAR
jgi:hypothetical protein